MHSHPALPNRKCVTLFGRYVALLGRIDAEKSNCSRAEDRESIHEGIRSSVGFAKLSRMVFGVMEGWLEEQLRKHAAVSAADGNVYDCLALRSALASVLLLKGQHSDAAAMYQEIFDSAQVSLPQNHPQIGALHALPSSLCHCLTWVISVAPAVLL